MTTTIRPDMTKEEILLQLEINRQEVHAGLDKVWKHFLFPWSKEVSLKDLIRLMKKSTDHCLTSGITKPYIPWEKT